MEPASQEDDKRSVHDKWYQSQPRGTMMGTVHGTYTKHFHCGVRIKAGVYVGQVPMSRETDKHKGRQGNVSLTRALGIGSGSMSCTDSLVMQVLHQPPCKRLSVE